MTSPAPLAAYAGAQAASQAAPALTLLPGGALGATLTLLERQGPVRESIATTVWELVRRVFGGVTDPRDPAQIDAVSAEVYRLVRSGQDATAAATATYLRGLLDQLGDRAAPVGSGAVVLDPSLRGLVDPASAYHRAFEQWRYARSVDLPEPAARDRGEQRLAAQVDMDLTMAMRESARTVLADADDVIGYRRVIHPELSRGGSCGLCVVAADRLYRKSELLPIHGRCRCTIAPVTRAHDPGAELNAADLEQLYGAAGSTGRADLKRVRVTVEQHGELGPQLRAA